MPQTAEDRETCFGSGGVLWLLANADGPKTARELTEESPLGHNGLSTVLTRCYRQGFVVRRKRPSDGIGANPYEYAIRPREDDE